MLEGEIFQSEKIVHAKALHWAFLAHEKERKMVTVVDALKATENMEPDEVEDPGQT